MVYMGKGLGLKKKRKEKPRYNHFIAGTINWRALLLILSPSNHALSSPHHTHPCTVESLLVQRCTTPHASAEASSSLQLLLVADFLCTIWEFIISYSISNPMINKLIYKTRQKVKINSYTLCSKQKWILMTLNTYMVDRLIHPGTKILYAKW